jgi:4-hydroxy-2-oxoheptanedioate aldolase
MRINTTKAKLAKDEPVFGAIVSEASPATVEIFGALGFDFVMIDCEHGAMSVDEVEHMVRAAEVFNITPIARIPDHAPATILRFLDRGVQGVIVPHVNTAEQAAAVARAARYYPDGNRGAASGRPHDYNIGVNGAESRRWLNENTLVIPMVEETEAVDNLDSILAVPGVDVLHVASGDLGQSMGYPPAAEVRNLMLQLMPRIKAGGKYAGIGGNAGADYGEIAGLIRAGARFVTISAQTLMRRGGQQFKDGMRAALGGV